MTDYPLIGVTRSRDPFFNSDPNHICGIAKARHFKFRMRLIHRSTGLCMIYYHTKGCVHCSESCHLFTFWKT